MDYRIIIYVGVGLVALYVGVRMFGEYALGKLINAELSQVIHGDEHKVKGKYE